MNLKPLVCLALEMRLSLQGMILIIPMLIIGSARAFQ